MPSTITHAYFTLDVLKKLPIFYRELLLDEMDMLKVYGQGMDTLFFYNITNLKKGKRVREFGHYFHRHQTQEFFITLINYIKYNYYKKTPSVMAFLYGMICHYTLDTTLHPYVVYKTGIYDKNNKNTCSCKQKHEHMETFLDNYLLFQREGVIPYKIRSDKFCFNLKEFDDSLKEVIDFTFKETFDINNMSKFYFKAIKQMKFFYCFFRNDRFGIKKIGYKIIDKVTNKKFYTFEVLSYHIDPIDKWDYLNKEKNIWNHPMNKKETFNYSFVELYLIAIKRAMDLINQVNEYIEGNEKVSLKKLFPDLSYATGKKCNSKKSMKYFAEKY